MEQHFFAQSKCQFTPLKMHYQFILLKIKISIHLAEDESAGSLCLRSMCQLTLPKRKVPLYFAYDEVSVHTA